MFDDLRISKKGAALELEWKSNSQISSSVAQMLCNSASSAASAGWVRPERAAAKYEYFRDFRVSQRTELDLVALIFRMASIDRSYARERSESILR